MEKERTSPWLILFRVVFTAALIACIMFIFRNSLETVPSRPHAAKPSCSWSTVRWPRCISAHCRSI